MRSLAAVAHAVLAFSFASSSMALEIDSMEIRHDIYATQDSNGDPLLFEGNPTNYRLVGQSAFIQSRAFSATSGGQLDGTTGFGLIGFTEIFPPATLSEYQTYSYLGIVDLEGTDANGDPVVIDRSLVIAFREGIAAGLRVEDLFADYTESVLVDAFTTSFDSPEFLDMAFSRVGGQPNTSGQMGVFSTDCHFTNLCDPVTQLQFEESLELVAFVGGINGDEGVVIGEIGFSMVRSINVIPEPNTALLFGMGLGMLSLARRRPN